MRLPHIHLYWQRFTNVVDENGELVGIIKRDACRCGSISLKHSGFWVPGDPVCEVCCQPFCDAMNHH